MAAHLTLKRKISILTGKLMGTKESTHTKKTVIVKIMVTPLILESKMPITQKSNGNSVYPKK